MADRKGGDEGGNEWRRAVRTVPTAGDPPPPTCDHTSVFCEPLRTLVIFGGHVAAVGVTAALYEFEIDSKVWREVEIQEPVKPCARDSHSAVAHEGQMMVFGGYGGPDCGMLNDGWIYHVEPKKWELLEMTGTVPTPRQQHSVARVGESKMLLFGGFDGDARLNDMYEYDLETGVWRDIAYTGLAPQPRDGAGIAILGEFLYLFGGYSLSKSQDLYTFHLETAVWCRLAPAPGVPTSRCGHRCEVHAERMYVFHGFNGTVGSALIWEYDPAGNRWRRLEFQGDPPVCVRAARGLHCCCCCCHAKPPDIAYSSAAARFTSADVPLNILWNRWIRR